MGSMFSTPVGISPAEKLHRLAFANQPVVKPDAYGLAFPSPDAYSKMPPAMRREAALLARESRAFDAFRAAAGCRVEDALRINPKELVKADNGDHPGAGNQNNAAERAQEFADEVEFIVDTYTRPSPGGFVPSVDLYRRAVADAVAPECGERFFAQILQQNHGAMQRNMPGDHSRRVCLIDRVMV